LPSYSNPLGALPARFRRTRLLIIGCGDIGLRAAGLLAQGVRRLALTSSPARISELRNQGITPLLGNLDDAASLRRLGGIATRVLHLAPPPGDDPQARDDPRTRNLLRALSRGGAPLSLTYGSTSGVYGDCAGAYVTETRPVNPKSPRAWRRVDAEAQLRHWGRASSAAVHILRIPGIYAPDRDGGTPRERLRKGTPVLAPADDVYTNHIHADDLARACVAALWRGQPQRISHASDDTALKMGDYFDLAARLYGLPLPPRMARAELGLSLSAMQLSFMSESRRLDNRRLKTELRLRLHFPTVAEGLAEPPLSPAGQTVAFTSSRA